MSTLQHIQQWTATHHPRWFVALRVALGLSLFAKGITFVSNSVLLEQLLGSASEGGRGDPGWLLLIITGANLLGGFMLVVGLMTRLVALLELPILVGAIIFINAQKEGLAIGSELGLAVLVLLLLIFFVIEGGGPLSLDNYFRKNRGKDSQGTSLP